MSDAVLPISPESNISYDSNAENRTPRNLSPPPPVIVVEEVEYETDDGTPSPEGYHMLREDNIQAGELYHEEDTVHVPANGMLSDRFKKLAVTKEDPQLPNERVSRTLFTEEIRSKKRSRSEESTDIESDAENNVAKEFRMAHQVGGPSSKIVKKCKTVPQPVQEESPKFVLHVTSERGEDRPLLPEIETSTFDIFEDSTATAAQTVAAAQSAPDLPTENTSLSADINGHDLPTATEGDNINMDVGIE